MTTFGPSASLEMLAFRHRLLKQVRAFFEDREFLEVCTPLLSSETFADRYLEPLRVTLFSDPKAPTCGPTWYLQTSPELHMKRLLASGAHAIYQITQSFRAGERGPHHNPEFTMLEWYRQGDDFDSGRQLLVQLLQETLPDIRLVEEISYRELFERVLGMNPHTATVEELQEVAWKQGLRTVDNRGDLLDALMATAIEPALDRQKAVVVHDFPEHQAALAQTALVQPHGYRVARRFEAYAAGLELANGYLELADSSEVEKRHLENCRERERQGREGFALPSHFVAAMQSGFPACVGVALGFDRLVMAASGQASLDFVQTFPAGKA